MISKSRSTSLPNDNNGTGAFWNGVLAVFVCSHDERTVEQQAYKSLPRQEASSQQQLLPCHVRFYLHVRIFYPAAAHFPLSPLHASRARRISFMSPRPR